MQKIKLKNPFPLSQWALAISPPARMSGLPFTRIFELLTTVLGTLGVCALIMMKRTRWIGIGLLALELTVIAWIILDKSGVVGTWPTGLN